MRKTDAAAWTWPKIPDLTTRAHLIILVGLTLALLLSGSGQLPLVDRDEPRFAEATREMMQRQDWMIPYFNGEYRFDKPPFIYWNMMLFYSTFGYHELCARLPAILHTLLLVLATYQIGSVFFTRTIGFCAAFGLMTCLQILIHGRLAVADLPMIFDLTVAQGLLMAIILPKQENHPWRNFWVFYFAQALGFLAKGPVVQIVTLLTLLLFRFAFWRHPLPWARLRLTRGLMVVLGVVGIWGVPALLQTHGLWWKVGIGQHVVARGMESFNGRAYFVPYYLVSALLSLCPWLPLVGYGWIALRQNWRAEIAFLCAWATATYLLFTCYSTQLPHYVLPAFPALFLLLAQIITLTSRPPAWVGYVQFAIAGFYFLIGLVALVLCLVVDRGTALQGVLIGLTLVLWSLLGLQQAFLRSGWKRMFLCLACTCAGWWLMGQNLQPLSPARPIGEMAQRLAPNAQCWARGFSEPSLVFYSNRHWQLDESLPALAGAFQQPDSGLIVELVEERSIGQAMTWLWRRLNDDQTPALAGKDYSGEIKELPTEGWHSEEITGLNLARSSWVRLKVYSRPMGMTPPTPNSDKPPGGGPSG